MVGAGQLHSELGKSDSIQWRHNHMARSLEARLLCRRNKAHTKKNIVLEPKTVIQYWNWRIRNTARASLLE